MRFEDVHGLQRIAAGQRDPAVTGRHSGTCGRASAPTFNPLWDGSHGLDGVRSDSFGFHFALVPSSAPSVAERTGHNRRARRHWVMFNTASAPAPGSELQYESGSADSAAMIEPATAAC